MLVCEWCLINVHHDVALHSARLLNNFDDIKKGIPVYWYEEYPHGKQAKSITRVFQQTFGAVAQMCQECGRYQSYRQVLVFSKSIFSYKVYP